MLRLYYVYIFTDRFRTEWYVGITTNLAGINLSCKKSGIFPGWLIAYQLVYYQCYPTFHEAYEAEKKIKNKINKDQYNCIPE